MSGGKEFSDPSHSTDPPNQDKKANHDEGGGLHGQEGALNTPELTDSPGLTTYPLQLRDKVVPILSPSFSVKSDGDDTVSLFTLSSGESDSPPSSVHSAVSRKSSLSIPRGANAMADPSASNPATPRPPMKSLTEHPTAPSDIMHFISTPECPYSHEEKAIIFKAILRTSILAYDSESRVSHFAWAHGQLERMDSNARATVLMHSEHTIASMCQLFLRAFDAMKPLPSLSDLSLPDEQETPDSPANPIAPITPVARAPQNEQNHCERRRTAFQASVIKGVEEKQRTKRESGSALDPDLKTSMKRVAALRDKLGKLKSTDSVTYSSLMQGSSQQDQQSGISGIRTLPQPSLFEPGSDGLTMNIYFASLQRQLQNKEAENKNKELEIERLQRKTLLFSQHEVDLKKKSTENASLAKEVADLKASVTQYEKTVRELQQYVKSANELMLSKEEAANIKFKILEESIFGLRGMVDEMDQVDADKTVDIQMLEYDVRELREQAEDAKLDTATTKLEMDLLRLAVSGDVDAMKAIKLIAILDQIKLDLCFILKIKNSNPRRFPSPVESYAYENGFTNLDAYMDIFCRASLAIEKEKDLPKHLWGYKSMFSIENFYKAFDLIFGNTSQIRFVRNQLAHALPKGDEDVPELIRSACPPHQEEIMTLCVSACDTYCPLKDRVEKQEDHEDESFQDMLTTKGTVDIDRWSKLGDWLAKTKVATTKAATIAVQAVANAEAKSAPGAGSKPASGARPGGKNK